MLCSRYHMNLGGYCRNNTYILIYIETYFISIKPNAYKIKTLHIAVRYWQQINHAGPYSECVRVSESLHFVWISLHVFMCGFHDGRLFVHSACQAALGQHLKKQRTMWGRSRSRGEEVPPSCLSTDCVFAVFLLRAQTQTRCPRFLQWRYFFSLQSKKQGSLIYFDNSDMHSGKKGEKKGKY